MMGSEVMGRGEVAPLQRPLLAVRLPEGERELGLHQLTAQIEGVRRLVDLELGEDVVDLRAADELLAVEDGDRLTIGEDAEVGCRDRSRMLASIRLCVRSNR